MLGRGGTDSLVSHCSSMWNTCSSPGVTPWCQIHGFILHNGINICKDGYDIQPLQQCSTVLMF